MFHGHVILLEDLVAVDFPSSYHWENQTPSANSRIFQIFLGKTYQVSYTSYKYIYISLYSVYIYHIYFISHIPMQCLLIEARGDPAGFIPTHSSHGRFTPASRGSRGSRGTDPLWWVGCGDCGRPRRRHLRG